MSRRLLTTRIAVTVHPTGTAASHTTPGAASACTKYVPTTATIPKNPNVNTSPSARYPIGHGPPV